MKRQQIRSAVTGLTFSALLLTGCATGVAGEDVAEEGVTEASDATLRIGLGSVVASLDPNARTSGPPATNVFYPVFDALVTLSDNGSALPALALDWAVLGEDSTTWQLKLRPDVMFSNGEAFDADDVKFTLDYVLDDANEQVVKARIDTIESVTIVDELTVDIRTTAPDPLLIKRLSSVFMFPNDYHQEVGAQKFGQEPIGTGPFSFESFTPSSSVVMEAVDGSWRGKPMIQRIEMTGMPDAAVRVAALRSGEIDIAEALPPDQAAILDGEASSSTESATLGQTNVIILDTTVEELADPRVRQALNHAVDKDALAKEIMNGFASPAGQLVADNGFGHDSSVSPYSYDPSKARELLADAGYADGFDLTIYTTQGMQTQDRQLTEATAGYLNEIGVNASVELIESGAFVDEYHGGGMTPAFFIGWWYFPAMDGDFIYVWNESSRPQSRWSNGEFDRLFAQSRSTLDETERARVMQEMGALVHEEAPAIFLVHPADVYGIADRVEGFVPRADRIIALDGITLSE